MRKGSVSRGSNRLRLLAEENKTLAYLKGIRKGHTFHALTVGKTVRGASPNELFSGTPRGHTLVSHPPRRQQSLFSETWSAWTAFLVFPMKLCARFAALSTKREGARDEAGLPSTKTTVHDCLYSFQLQWQPISLSVQKYIYYRAAEKCTPNICRIHATRRKSKLKIYKPAQSYTRYVHPTNIFIKLHFRDKIETRRATWPIKCSEGKNFIVAIFNVYFDHRINTWKVKKNSRKPNNYSVCVTVTSK